MRGFDTLEEAKECAAQCATIVTGGLHSEGPLSVTLPARLFDLSVASAPRRSTPRRLPVVPGPLS